MRYSNRLPNKFYIGRGNDSDNMMLSLACFRLMRNGLKFNICDLETSCLRNRDVKDMSKRIEAKITGSLLYSCRFWAFHLRDAMTNRYAQGVLLGEVKEFFDVRLLFWLEVMSLTGEVTAAKSALLIVVQLVEVRSFLLAVGSHC